MLKRIVGVVLFLIGIILLLSLVSSVLKMILLEEKDIIGQDESYVIGYYSGKITLILVFCFLNFLCFKYGYRFMRGKRDTKEEDEIQIIGKN